MGGGDDADDFTAEAEYLEFLEYYKTQHHWLVGDTYELGQESMQNIRRAHRAVFDKWKTIEKYDTIRGNHDPGAGHHSQTISVGDRRIIILHGHQYDEANRSGSSLGKIVTQVVGMLERSVHKDVDRWLGVLYRRIEMRIEEYQKKLIQLAKAHDCNTVVYSHTHMPGLDVIDGIEIACCGTWTHKFKDLNTGEMLGYPYIRLGCKGKMHLQYWRS